MPRPQSENTYQISLKIPEDWTDRADNLAAAMSQPGIAITRTDVIRIALARGLDDLESEHQPKKGSKR